MDIHVGDIVMLTRYSSGFCIVEQIYEGGERVELRKVGTRSAKMRRESRTFTYGTSSIINAHQAIDELKSRVLALQMRPDVAV